MFTTVPLFRRNVKKNFMVSHGLKHSSRRAVFSSFQNAPTCFLLKVTKNTVFRVCPYNYVCLHYVWQAQLHSRSKPVACRPCSGSYPPASSLLPPPDLPPSLPQVSSGTTELYFSTVALTTVYVCHCAMCSMSFIVYRS